ncbi:APC family permease [Micromonospora sp. WMMD1102]|uniref:APC family permease n=1 Tax=Micromonospora sp. WMMD1102 TaxID=3016105 RepID=UPI002414FCCD|nr:APC family permease [Micromonospora sp. WMMD1102]MDG4787651.1 APC family permease [Micromonospora sp. WMMD1102]
MTPLALTARRDPVRTTLAVDRLGVPAVVFFVMSAATPLTVVAGVVTTGYAATGLTGIPVAFILVGLLLGLFSVGYVAMARHMTNTGAFYAYISQGLGRPIGVGAAWVALVAYNGLQVGLYGAIGAATSPLLDQWFGLNFPWWIIALCAWALTAILGVLRVDLNGKVLAVLLVAEIVIIMIYNIGNLSHPADGQVTFDTLNPGNLIGPALGALVILAGLGFIGFEIGATFGEETRDPRRTVPIATYLSVGLIGVILAISAWAMTVATGPDRIVEVSRAEGTEVIFNLAGAHFGQAMVDIGHTLFVTSILAATFSFHHTTARYMFALGREHVLPAALGRTARRSGAPRNASLWQSAIGLTVIIMYATNGWDPVVQLFYWLGTGGGLGVLFLITTTSISVIAFFARDRHGEPAWRRVIAPTIATLVLLGAIGLAIVNVATLLGVPDDHPLATGIPAVYLGAAFLGIGWGMILKATRPEVYATIGLGARSASGRLSATTPRPRADDDRTAADVLAAHP